MEELEIIMQADRNALGLRGLEGWDRKGEIGIEGEKEEGERVNG